jgi:zinc transporter ZupT
MTQDCLNSPSTADVSKRLPKGIHVIGAERLSDPSVEGISRRKRIRKKEDPSTNPTSWSYIFILHMAAGVSVCSAEGATEWGVSFGIALQNIPEGMVIIAPLMMAGVTAVRTFFISIFIALLEVVGILLGFGLGSASSTFLPVMLGFAGGAMLYVTSDEMIPETHAHGFQKQATYALLLGFITFVLMEKCV